jgi:hypothetical protein
LNAQGVPAETDSIWGVPAGFSYAQLAAYDSRFTQSGTAGLGGGGSVKSLAGNMFKLTAAGDQVGFAGEKAVNVCDIWYPSEGQFGTFSVQVDAGASQIVNEATYGGVWTLSGGTWVQTTAPTPTSGRFARAQFRLDTTSSHTIKATWASGAVHIAGIHCFRSDVAQMALYIWGRPGETAVNWAAGNGAGSWNVMASTNNGPLEYLPFDLAIADIGINDANVGVTDAAFSTALQSLITGFTTRGSHDLALVVPMASNFSSIPEAAQRGKWEKIEFLSILNGVPIIADMGQRWGYYATGSARGYYADNTHGSDKGQADKAQAIARVILAQ